MSDIPYEPPVWSKKAFNCPFCRVNAPQNFSAMSNNAAPSGYTGARCGHCGKVSIWLKERMIWPDLLTAPRPHEDLPVDCRPDYEEARQVLAVSPRAAAGLLRLVIQKLMVHLGQKGKKIDDDIASLVEGGLPVKIQQALDACRIVGNEAVHPGSIDLNATPGMALALFDLVNLIVENQIAEPKRIDALYNSLPAAKLKGVEERDKKGEG
jgi:hypothetical protein